MRDDPFHILRLRPEPDRPLTAAFREVLVALLERMDATFPNDGRIHQRIVPCEEAVRDADDPKDISNAGQMLQGVVDELLERVRHEADLRNELKSAIGTIREAITSIAGEESAHRDELLNSADRFEKLQNLEDIDVLKSCLVHEVSTLKVLTARREAHWQRVMVGFESKIASLEDQLVDTLEDATHDELTGLANRRHIAESFAKLKKQHRPFVLGMADLDDFKRVNDEYGHLRGDSVLQEVAKLLNSSVRATDVVGRLGGDEFVVLLHDVTLHQAEGRFRALSKTVQTQLSSDAQGPSVAFSCGLAEYSAGDTLQSLMQRADQALYEAKRLGKNRVISKAAPYIRDIR